MTSAVVATTAYRRRYGGFGRVYRETLERVGASGTRRV